MKRRLGPDEVAVWSVVAATVKPMKGRTVPSAEAASEAAPTPKGRKTPAAALHVPPSPHPPPKRPPAPTIRALHSIEPNRERRLARGRDLLEARIDLHGMDQDRARAALERFLLAAQAEGHRAVLVITGKGIGGDGVLRRRLPDWLLSPPLRSIVAGVSEARRRHGGKGAVYVALKRRTEA